MFIFKKSYIIRCNKYNDGWSINDFKNTNCGFDLATQFGNLHAIKWLYHYHYSKYFDPIESAIEYKHNNIAKWFSVNMPEIYDYECIECAIYNNNFEMVKWFCENKLDPTIDDPKCLLCLAEDTLVECSEDLIENTIEDINEMKKIVNFLKQHYPQFA